LDFANMAHITNHETTIEASDVLAVGLFICAHQPQILQLFASQGVFM
tara:strand:- start:4998 stop:5138 length:141 start_codon:yes stop_codon:yes gene_type:complete